MLPLVSVGRLLKGARTLNTGRLVVVSYRRLCGKSTVCSVLSSVSRLLQNVAVWLRLPALSAAQLTTAALSWRKCEAQVVSWLCGFYVGGGGFCDSSVGSVGELVTVGLLVSCRADGIVMWC